MKNIDISKLVSISALLACFYLVMALILMLIYGFMSPEKKERLKYIEDKYKENMGYFSLWLSIYITSEILAPILSPSHQYKGSFILTIILVLIFIYFGFVLYRVKQKYFSYVVIEIMSASIGAFVYIYLELNNSEGVIIKRTKFILLLIGLLFVVVRSFESADKWINKKNDKSSSKWKFWSEINSKEVDYVILVHGTLGLICLMGTAIWYIFFM